MTKLWLILVLVFFGCAHPDRLHGDENYSFKVDFRHSFATPVTLHLTKTSQGTTAIAEVFDIFNETKPSTIRDTALLSEAEVERFFDIIGNTPLFKLDSDSSGRGESTDGGATYFTLIQGNRRNYFEVEDWVTYKKGSPYAKTVNAVFYILSKKFPLFEAYLEQNERVFPHGLAVKARGNNPKVVRLYGRYFDQDSVELSHVLQRIPANETVTLDVSNIENFTSATQLFLGFERTHPKMAWVIGEVPRDSSFRWQFYRDNKFDTTRMFKIPLVLPDIFDKSVAANTVFLKQRLDYKGSRLYLYVTTEQR